MKQIINGKRYNTATATLIADISPTGYFLGDFRYEETAIYRTARGSWFVAGKGGALSRWAKSVGQSGSCGGAGIEAITADEARSLLEVHREIGALERYFSEAIEDA